MEKLYLMSMVKLFSKVFQVLWTYLKQLKVEDCTYSNPPLANFAFRLRGTGEKTNQGSPFNVQSILNLVIFLVSSNRKTKLSHITKLRNHRQDGKQQKYD